MTTTFKLEHEFPDIPLDLFIAHLNDPKLNDMLLQGLKFKERAMLKRIETPDGIEWHFRVKKSGDFPKAIQKIIKEETLVWEEKSHFVRKENCLHWEILPLTKLFKFHGRGVWQLKAFKHGCKRIIEGEITVDIPLVGKMVEGFIVNELIKTYDVEPSIQKKFYAELS